MEHHILLDVGGTMIKSATMTDDGELGTVTYHDSCSSGSAQIIFDNLAKIISEERRKLPCLDAIAFAFPGPFDYQEGVSLMKGLGKYDAIYGMPIWEHVYGCLEGYDYSSVRVSFLHDVQAFALGSHAHSLFHTTKRSLFVALGTGAGSAFMDDGKLVIRNGVPENGWIYSLPFRSGQIDDYLSARGQEALCLKFFGHSIDGKELDRMARAGDAGAIALFKEFGSDIAEALAPILISFHPRYLVLGGQIAKSYPLFSHAIDTLCKELGIEVVIETDTSLRIFQGLLEGGTIDA